MDFKDELITKVAWYYYIEDLTQQEVAERLNLSRMKVVKILELARKQGVVQFNIRADAKRRILLEKELTERYSLKDSFVTPTSDHINRSIAKAAAQYISQYVEDYTVKDCYINVGYGDTVTRITCDLMSSLSENTSLVSLTGGVTYYTSLFIRSNKGCNTNFISNYYIVPSPLLVSNEEIAKAFLQEAAIKEIMNLHSLASLTVVGIGAVSESVTLFKDNMITANDLALLKKLGAVGDILSQFYDKDGNKIECDLHKRLVSLEIENLKTLGSVIGAAGGSEKVEAIRAALKGNYLDVLITDEDTAIKLTKKMGN